MLHIEEITFHVQATLDKLTIKVLKDVKGMTYFGLEVNAENTAVS